MDTVLLRNATLGVTKPFPNRPEVIAFWATKGWLPVDPSVPVPVFDPALDQSVAGVVGVPTSQTGVALRAALVPRDQLVVNAPRPANPTAGTVRVYVP